MTQYVGLQKKSSLPWGKIFLGSVQMMLKSYGIIEGVIAIDETDKPRSKNTPFINYAHKYFEKNTDSYKKGQGIVFFSIDYPYSGYSSWL